MPQIDMDSWTTQGATLECTSYRSFWTNMTRNEDTWRYKDYGDNHFNSGGTFYFTFSFHAAVTAGLGVLLMLSQDVDDLFGLYSANKNLLSIYIIDSGAGADPGIYLYQRYGASNVSTSVSILDTYRYRPLYCKAVWTTTGGTGGFGTLVLNIYREQSLVTQLYTATINLGADNDYRYLWMANSYNEGAGGAAKTVTGWSGHLYIDEVPPAIFTEYKKFVPFSPTFSDGFENGHPNGDIIWTDNVEGASATVAISTTVVKSGTYSLKIFHDTATDKTANCHFVPGSGLKSRTMQFDFYLDSLSTENDIFQICAMMDITAGNHFIAEVENTGGLYYLTLSKYTAGVRTEGTVKKTISLQTWYTLTLLYSDYTMYGVLLCDGDYVSHILMDCPTIGNASGRINLGGFGAIAGLKGGTGYYENFRYLNGTTYFPVPCRGGVGDATLALGLAVNDAHSTSGSYGNPMQILYKVGGATEFSSGTSLTIASTMVWPTGGIRWDASTSRWLVFSRHHTSGQAYPHTVVYYCTDAELKSGTLDLNDRTHTLKDYWEYDSGEADNVDEATTELQDSAKSWETNQFVGWVVYNVTQSQSAYISSNTSNTITHAALSGGVHWDTGDHYHIRAPVVMYASREEIGGTLLVGLEYAGAVASATYNYLETARIELTTGALTYRSLFAHYDEGLGANYVAVAEPTIWIGSDGKLRASLRACGGSGTYNLFRFRTSDDMGITAFDGEALESFGANWDGHNAIPRFFVFGDYLWAQSRVNLPQGSASVYEWYTSVRKVSRSDGDVIAEFWWESLGEGGNGDIDGVSSSVEIYYIDYASDFYSCAQYRQLTSDLTLEAACFSQSALTMLYLNML